MIEMALIGGAIIGLRCRAVLILVGAAAIFAAGVIGHVSADETLERAVLFALLGAAVAQIAALVVHSLKEGIGGLLSAPA